MMFIKKGATLKIISDIKIKTSNSEFLAKYFPNYTFKKIIIFITFKHFCKWISDHFGQEIHILFLREFNKMHFKI